MAIVVIQVDGHCRCRWQVHQRCRGAVEQVLPRRRPARVKPGSSRTLAQPHQRVFQSVIKSAASAASPTTKIHRKYRESDIVSVFNPHQRCGYSDSPFARIHYFYIAGSRNGLEGWNCCVHSQEITKMGRFRIKITKIRV